MPELELVEASPQWVLGLAFQVPQQELWQAWPQLQ